MLYYLWVYHDRAVSLCIHECIQRRQNKGHLLLIFTLNCSLPYQILENVKMYISVRNHTTFCSVSQHCLTDVQIFLMHLFLYFPGASYNKEQLWLENNWYLTGILFNLNFTWFNVNRSSFMFFKCCSFSSTSYQNKKWEL